MNNTVNEGGQQLRIEYRRVMKVAQRSHSVGKGHSAMEVARATMASLRPGATRTQILGPWIEAATDGTIEQRGRIATNPGATRSASGSAYPMAAKTLDTATTITVAIAQLERLVVEGIETGISLDSDPRWETMTQAPPILYVESAFDEKGAAVAIPGEVALTEVRRIGVEMLVPHCEMVDVTCLRGHWDDAVDAALAHEGDGTDAQWDGAIGPYITTNAGEGEDPSRAHHVPETFSAATVVKNDLHLT